MMKKDVIVYGIGNSLLQALDYIKNRFHIIGCSDSDTDTDKRIRAVALGIHFYTLEEIKRVAFDYIVITSIYDDEIFEYLLKSGLDEKKILKRNEWYHMTFKTSFGEKHPESTYYIIARPIRVKNGLMSYLFLTLQQLGEIEGKGYLPVVDMKNYPNQYQESPDINTWTQYFEPIVDVDFEEVYKSKNVILGYDDPNYLTDYQNKYNLQLMHEMYVKYIRIKKEVEAYIDSEYKRIFADAKKPLGVLLRGTDMSCLKLKDHPIQPEVQEMIQCVKKNMNAWKCDLLYLCTEDAEIEKEFRNYFGNIVVCSEQRRFQNTGNQWLADIEIKRENDKYLRGLEYLTAISLLARCDNLITSVCCGSVCAQIIHGMEYENIVIMDKGTYK